MNSRKAVPCLIVALLVLCPLAAVVYSIPPVRERLDSQVAAWRQQTRSLASQPTARATSTPDGVIHGPFRGAVTAPPSPPDTDLSPDLPLDLENAAATEPPFFDATAIIEEFLPTEPASTPATPAPTAPPTPLPPSARVSGVAHTYQGFNNSGPANLAMVLNYWGWKGTQDDIAQVVRPNRRDAAVMPYELETFVEENAGLGAIVRSGGEVGTLKAFTAAGFPVIIARGYTGPDTEGWIGHYEVITGYDDNFGNLVMEDTLAGPHLQVSYDRLLSDWRAFNYLYLIVYPPERELEVYSLLGANADETHNLQTAAARAAVESQSLTGRDRFFAWYNQGTSLVGLKDYQAASLAFDAALANLNLIPEPERPWRILWYQTGPYWAYYYGQRYADVLNLADETLRKMGSPGLEESFYWRGLAKLALGDPDGATKDFNQSLEIHPGFIPALEQLTALGVNSE